MSHPAAHLTLANGNSQRQECLMRFQLVPIPIPSSGPGKCSATALSQPSNQSSPRGCSLESPVFCRQATISWKTGRLDSLGHQGVPAANLHQSPLPAESERPFQATTQVSGSTAPSSPFSEIGLPGNGPVKLQGSKTMGQWSWSPTS